MTELFKQIKKRRIEIGMSQETLAEKLGYDSRSTISKIESGKIDIPQSRIEAFAEVLKTTPSDLMGWNEYSTEEENINCFGNTIQDSEASYQRIDSETLKIAQAISANPGLKALFETTQNINPEDINLIAEMVKRMSHNKAD